jgi:propanediol utilization protein
VQDGSSGLIATDVTNGDLKLQANGTGNIEIDQLSINGDSITSIVTNGSVDITGNGTGGVNIEALSFNGTSISSTDSSTINLNENVNVDGDLNVTGNITGTFSVSAIGDITAVGSTLTAPSNADLTLTTSGTGSVSVDGIQIKGTELSSTDSSQITIKENLHVTGNITGTIDADNSTVSNLEVDNFKAASIVTEAEGIGSNDNDTTLPTSAAVKDYVDARDIGDLSVVGSTISAPSNADLTLTTSGTGSVSIDGIQISGTELSSSDSTQITIKENLHVTGNISGTITGTVSTLDADNSTVSNLEVDNFKASAIVTVAETLASNDSDTALVTAGAIIDYVDAQDANIASDTLTLTNKTFDANGTGNSISNIEVADFAAASIVTEAEGIGSNDNDTTIPTSAAVKDYVDNNAGGTTGDLAITGSTISAPSNADLTLTTSGTGSVSVDGIQIKGTEISSSDSTQVTIKENLHVTGNITGTITGSIDADNSTISNLEVDNFKASAIVTEGEGIGSNDNDTTIPTSAAVKDYVDSNPTTSLAADNLTTGDASVTITTTTGDITLDTQQSNRDIIFKGTDDGVDITPLQLDMSEGGKAIFSGVVIADNTITSRSSNADLELNASGTGTVVLENLKVGTSGSTVTTILDEDNMATNSDTALATQQSIKAYVDSEISGVGGASTGDLTFTGSTIISPSNADITLDPSGTGGVVAQGPVTFNAGYIEKINTLTSSSTITVNCALASIHTVTLGTSTEFNITNLPTGGSVTLIITQDGTGNRTATFGTDGSSAVKFPSNSSTLSTGGGDIDVVTIINDGTNFLGNIAKDYRSS